MCIIMVCSRPLFLIDPRYRVLLHFLPHLGHFCQTLLHCCSTIDGVPVAVHWDRSQRGLVHIGAFDLVHWARVRQSKGAKCFFFLVGSSKVLSSVEWLDDLGRLVGRACRRLLLGRWGDRACHGLFSSGLEVRRLLIPLGHSEEI